MSKDMEKLTQEYTSLYQQWQLVVMQKDQLLAQLNEIENANKEIKNSKEEEIYKIVGNIMIKKTKEELEKEINSAKEVLSIKINGLEKQEKLLRDKLAELQKKMQQK